MRVYGEQAGERIYGQQEIAETPSSNRDLSTLVAVSYTHLDVYKRQGQAPLQFYDKVPLKFSEYGDNAFKRCV